jgi:hypothetical protein
MLAVVKLVCHFTTVDGALPTQQLGSAGAAGTLIDSSSISDKQWAIKQLQMSSLLRPLVLYMQYALILASVTGVELPASLEYPLQALAWAWAPAVPETLSIECILPHGSSSMPVSVQRMLFYLALPVVMWLLLLAVNAVHALIRMWRSRSASYDTVVCWKGRAAVAAMVVCLFFLPAVLRIALSWFACIPIDAPVAAPYVAGAVGSFWLHDPDQLCYQGYHRAWALGLGLPLLLLVCGCLPAAILCAVLRRKQQEAPDAHASALSLAFLVWCYKPEYCWWDAAVLMQTALLTVVSIYGNFLGPLHQLIAFSCACAVMVLVWKAAQPFVMKAANTVMLQGVCCLFLASMSNVLYLEYSSFKLAAGIGIAVSSVVLCCNTVFVASVMWRMAMLFSSSTALAAED